VAGLLLTTEAAVVEKPKPSAGAPGPGAGMEGMGGMGGMGGTSRLDALPASVARLRARRATLESPASSRAKRGSGRRAMPADTRTVGLAGCCLSAAC
jgi:hypothetical protein